VAAETKPANAPQEITILDVHDLPSPDPARLGKTDRLVIYSTDAAHRYAVRLPAETFSEDALRAAIRADLAQRAKWTGRKFTM
jgi:hypothetical protein